MGNKSAIYWIILLLAVAAVTVAFFLRSSPDEHLRQMAKYLGWGAIVLLVIARFALRPKRQPEPPMPRD
jgi:cytochrome b561